MKTQNSRKAESKPGSIPEENIASVSQGKSGIEVGTPNIEPSEVPEDGPLSDVQKSELERCKTIVVKYGKSQFEVGDALNTIQKDRLYRATHDTFEVYVNEVFEMHYTRARQLIAAASVYSDIKSRLSDKNGSTDVDLPTCEGQVRSLAKLTSEDRAKVWKKCLKKAKGTRVTSQMVQESIDVAVNSKTAGKSVGQRLSIKVLINGEDVEVR